VAPHSHSESERVKLCGAVQARERERRKSNARIERALLLAGGLGLLRTSLRDGQPFAKASGVRRRDCAVGRVSTRHQTVGMNSSYMDVANAGHVGNIDRPAYDRTFELTTSRF
jgi:hypothetical protein